MKPIRYLCLFCFLLFGNSLLAQEIIKPFQTHNQSPFVHFFGLPSSRGGSLLKKGDLCIGNYFNISNNATSSQKNEETIYLDGEMYRNELQISYGLLSKLEVGILIPVVNHSGGIMDSFISNWHKTFNLPEVGRKGMPAYKLSYFLLENKKVMFNMNSSKLSLGDIAISLSTPLLSGKNHTLAMQSFFKFATGKKDILVGSGTNDIAFQIMGTINPIIERGQFSFFYSLGYLRVGKGAVLDYLTSRSVCFGSIGLAHRINNKFYLKSQVDFHTGFYKKSNTKQLGSSSGQLAFGLDYFSSTKLAFSLALIEDIFVNTSPDLTLQLAVSYHFK